VSEQPAPTPGHENVMNEARRRLMQALDEREKKGLETYGRPLETFNGRDALQDAEEELLDRYVYLLQARMEREELRAEIERLKGVIAVADVLCEAVARLVVGSICIASENGEGLGYRVDGPAWRRAEGVMMDYAEARGEYEEGR
jgi:hypothetical protein